MGREMQRVQGMQWQKPQEKMLKCYNPGLRLQVGRWNASQEVIFASLGPEVTAVIERRYGKLTLQAESVSDLPR